MILRLSPGGGVVLAAGSERGIEVLQQVGDDGRQRGVVAKGPDPGLAIRDGDGDVLDPSDHVALLKVKGYFHCAPGGRNCLQSWGNYSGNNILGNSTGFR